MIRQNKVPLAVLAALFIAWHVAPRFDDPLLHTHVLVANLARTTDEGIWRTLDSRKLYAHAKTAGVRPGWHRQLVGNTSWEQPDVAELWQHLVVDEGLTESSSSFTRRDVLQQLAGQLPDGAPVDYVEQVADAILRQETDEQAVMVRQLASTGAGVEVVVGKAGTGKTYALDAAREAWEASGIRVTGVALAARAALELQSSAGIRSTTLTRLLGQVDDGRDGSPLQPGSVLVVDEAGMVGTRQLARLLHHAEQQSVQVVLVGDPHQLPEMDAGGLFRALATRPPAIQLTHNRRQKHTWEQTALDELRHGNPDTALAAYRQHGRIRTADTAEHLRDQLVNDWWDTAKENLPGSLMIALRRDDVADLNHREHNPA